MSAEAGLIGFFSKPIVWLLGLIKALVIYIWYDNANKVKQNKDAIKAMDKKLDDKYYTREHVDLLLHPVKDSIDKNTEATAKLANCVHELAIKVAEHK